MADIRSYPFLAHVRGRPTTYIRHARNGRIGHEGVGRSFWFRPLSAILSEVPVDDRDLPLLFHARTADFQDVVVQLTVTFRLIDPGLASERIDFGVDSKTGLWVSAPLEQLGMLLTDLAQQHTLETVARLTLAEALVEAPRLLRERIETGLAEDGRLQEIGLEVVSLRVGPVRPESDLEKALGTPARELVQQLADRAVFERRALAVESERAIAENELDNQIELARREQELIAQRGENEQRRVEASAAASKVEATAFAEKTRMLGGAEGDAEKARMAAYGEIDHRTLVALALRDLALNLPEIGQLTVTPDMLTAALAQIVSGK
jgi:regulator of protease activity HflC (stomatin/prohibitin superfamily)